MKTKSNNEKFDVYEVYYFDELIAEVRDYRKGFDSVIYGLSADARIIKVDHTEGVESNEGELSASIL